VLPTYVFSGSLGLLLVWGFLRVIVLGRTPHVASAAAAVEGLSVFLVLRRLHGHDRHRGARERCARLPGAGDSQRSQHARQAVRNPRGPLPGGGGARPRDRRVPSDRANVVAEIGLAVVGTSPLFYTVQFSAAVILVLAANTSFNGFPRLAAVMAEDQFSQHLFGLVGLRLAYTTGIVVLSALAIGLILLFNGSTHALIPLFAVGVFLCFTLSQAGMVRHWLRTRDGGWRYKMADPHHRPLARRPSDRAARSPRDAARPDSPPPA
jgi:Amino acid permease